MPISYRRLKQAQTNTAVLLVQGFETGLLTPSGRIRYSAGSIHKVDENRLFALRLKLNGHRHAWLRAGASLAIAKKAVSPES